MMLTDLQWAKDHAWLMPALWIAAGVCGLFALVASKQMVALPALDQTTIICVFPDW